MDLEEVRAHCLALKAASEQVQWGDDLVFKVGGKMFAVLALEPTRVALSFKCSVEEFARLSECPGCLPAPYLARAKWIALERLDVLPGNEVRRLLTASHELVVASLPKKVRTAL
jgi:predicted DNA-binding protein (MmcQ/YjbR family)